MFPDLLIPGCILLLDGVTVVIKYGNSFTAVALSVLFLFISIALHRILHEAGHWLGGRIDGYGFVYVIMGPVLITNTPEGRIAFKLTSKPGMQCVMYSKKTINRKYFAYNAGGVLANLLLVLMAFGCMLRCSDVLHLLSMQIFIAGIGEIALNGIPFYKNNHPNDALTIKLLRASENTLTDYICYLQLYADYYLERDIDYEQFIYQHDKTDLKYEDFFYSQLNKILKIVILEKTANKRKVQEYENKGN